ncbi:MAG: hypothetical protein HQK62_10110 [Desulfamplus sp.]|nr:hypothetical protein [Desulfamplus sp.]
MATTKNESLIITAISRDFHIKNNEAPRCKRRAIFKNITTPQGAGYEPELRNQR